MDKNLPTVGQLERSICQGVQQLYRQELGHSPDRVICQIFGNQLAIVIEKSLTNLEKTLAKTENNSKTAAQLNAAINDAIELKLKTLIEDVLDIEVDDILFDSAFNSDRAGAIVTLEKIPLVRNPQSIPKNKNKSSQCPDEVDPSETS